MPRPADLDDRSAGPPALRWQEVAWLGALIAAIWLVYIQVRHHGFVRFDDFEYIVDNPHVNQGWTAAGLRWAFVAFHAGNWHPLTWLSHMLDAELFGLRAGGHHLVSVLLHIANSGLLFQALRRLTGTLRPSLIVAGLFALHPLRVESVAWAAERKDLLAALFFMLTLLAYERYVRRPGPARYLVVAAALTAGLLSKPMLVTVPVVLLLLDFWPLARRGLRARVYEKIPLLLLAGGSVAVTWLAQHGGGAVEKLSQLPPIVRGANTLVSYVGYLWKTVWPANLAFYYPHPALIHDDPLAGLALPALVAGVMLTAISALAWLQRKRAPYLATGWLWFVVMLLPVIGLLQVGNQAMADRYAYLPLIGIYIAIVWLARDLLRHRPRLRRAAYGATLAVLALFAVASRRQVATWKDSETLFTRAIAVTERNYVAHTNLGNVYARRGELEQAAAEYRHALAVRGDFVEAHNNYGAILARRGRHLAAIEHYRRATQLRPAYANAHFNLGLSLAALGERQPAAAAFRRALELDPALEQARRELAALGYES